MADRSAPAEPAGLSARAAFAALLGSRIRSQYAYRTSFWLSVATSVAVGFIEFTETYVILANVPVFGGLTFPQVALVFALANMGFALADLVFGQLDQTASYIRLGTLETLLTRPMPLMVQLILSDFQLRRLGRVLVGAFILAVALPALELELTPARTYLLLISPVVGAAIYGGLFALAGGLQFFLVEGQEFTNAFVYGGSYAGQTPASALVTPIRVLFTFVFPASITGYAPALVILGLPGPAWFPDWLGWCGPLFAAWTWVLAGLAWRTGVRHYVGAGG